MRLAQRLSRVKPSATLAVNAKAQELRAKGRLIISLSVGEPDFPVPEYVRRAAVEAAERGEGRYTAVPGIPALRDAVAGYFKRFYGVDAPAEATMVSNGGKQVLFNLFQVLLDPGDEVLIPAPYWVSYPEMVRLADAEPVFLATSAGSGFKLQPDELESAITSKSRMLILNSPSNPTGSVYSKKELYALAQLAVDKGLVVVSDEVYDQMVYSPAESSSLSELWLRHPEQVVVCGALSKSFCVPGWRLGWALVHPDLIKAMVKVQGQSTSNVCTLTQHAAVAALNSGFEDIAAMREAFRKRRDLMMNILDSWPNALCLRPDGAFYLFPDLHAYYKGDVQDSTGLCTKILEEQGVAIVPGVAFGDDRCVRISYAVKEETLINAMERIAKVLRVG